ncbi:MULTISPECIES: ABC transporter substrate-binding protein [unclassified Paenibacillus]|uniref:ABC transporter substrate-binding protein n=1 Tax=unclassified Paenibacillus TaxID=185978 RepID=UPI002406B038|nr:MULTISPECIES: ABC transporter substrate-binding protein [unclassified Paenibacillus]MDF9839759.1 NitT/TauT family transport system substrate-binding protein [Paenibacillus sp. PastF-2]MDF9846339.1 NitT/TauT family transport system substrate-binding protein [Paenibacillus sp. PastM-2]MDF9853311.1 NitT/TauT family transport system substrate-binding protein [Paenibacillus sp. PastF-1]MDH6478185.1 NitT/TauT family transport system substrate-binding protein [Paenibacillus sp. PastH-2]MDH6506316.
MKRKFSGRRWLILMFVSGIALTGCGANNNSAGSGAAPASASAVPAESQELTEVTVAIAASGIAYGPMYLAQEENMWADYGLKVKLVSLDVAATTAGVITGDVPIAFGGGNVVDAAVKSDKVKLVGTIGSIPFMLYAKNIDKLEDLKGKVVGVSAPGSNPEYAVLTLTESLGLEPRKDVPILYIGNTGLAAVSEGKVEATLLVPPMSFQADEMGLHNLATMSDLEGIKGLYMVGAVHRPYAEEHPEVIENFYKAYAAASERAKTDKEATLSALSTWTKVTDQDALDRAYEYFKSYWPTDLHVPESEIQFLLDELASTTNPAAKNVKPADILDNSYVDAAQ